MLTFIVLPHWSIMPQTLDMIPHPVTLSWHWVDQFLLYPVSLSAKRGAASTIFNNLGMSWPEIEPVTSHQLTETLPTELSGPVRCKQADFMEGYNLFRAKLSRKDTGWSWPTRDIKCPYQINLTIFSWDSQVDHKRDLNYISWEIYHAN